MSMIVQIISSCMLGFLFILMDTISYGKALIPNHENLSMFIFLTATIVSQIFYNLFTSIPSGIMASSIVENISIFAEIHKETQDITNTLFCIFISTLLVGVLSLILSKYSQYLKLMPKSAITGCLGAIGAAQFSVGYDEISGNYFMHILILTAIVALVGFILQERFSNLIFIVPLYAAILVSAFYLFAYNKIENMREMNVLCKYQNITLGIDLLTKNIVFRNIDPKIIARNIINILKVVVFSMIHLPINLPAYRLETGLAANFTTEMNVQGVANLVCAFAFSPVYFVCSNSIFFRRSGGNKKIFGIVLGCALVLIYFYGTLVRSYIPVFILGMFPFLIGISILYSTYSEVKTGTLFDCLVVISTVLIGTFWDMLYGMVYGIILNLIWFIKTYLQSLKNKRRSGEEINEMIMKKQRSNKGLNTREMSNDDIIIIDYILFFCTVPRFEQQIKKIRNDVIFVVDYEMDWLGRDSFYGAVNRMAEAGNVTVIGRFASLDTKNFSNKVVYRESIEEYVNDAKLNFYD